MKPAGQINNIDDAIDLIEAAQVLLEKAGLIAESARLDAIVLELDSEAEYIDITELSDIKPRQPVGINHNF